MRPLLELRDVQVSYDGRTALDVPRLTVERGEILSLIGHNGSGKSTLLRVLGLLRAPSRGAVLLDGEPVEHGQPRRLLEQRRRMSGVLQEPLLCKMSVEQNVALGLRFRRVPRREARRRVDEWLERLHIGHLARRPAGALSGGEAQRASLARALVLEPEVLLLDEPFSALDAPTRQQLLHEFQEILREARVTTVFATHDRGEVLGLGDRVAVLIGGRLAQLGSAEEIFARPESEEVARFLGTETLIPGRVTGAADGLVQVSCSGAELEVAGRCRVGESVLVSVRPEEITVFAGERPTGSARNVLTGRVTKIVPSESHYRVEVDCGVPIVAAVTRPSFRELGLDVGRQVHVAFKAVGAHLIERRQDTPAG